MSESAVPLALKASLKRAHKHLLLLMAWHHTVKWGCYASVDTLAAEMGVGRRYVFDLLEDLVDWGYIRVHPTMKKKSTVYQLWCDWGGDPHPVPHRIAKQWRSSSNEGVAAAR